MFKTVQSLQDAVTEQEHSVKAKKVAVKKAKAKEGKIYVGKLKPELSDEEIKSHFAQFGNISAVSSLSTVICSFTITFVSLPGGAAFRQDKEREEKFLFYHF